MKTRILPTLLQKKKIMVIILMTSILSLFLTNCVGISSNIHVSAADTEAKNTAINAWIAMLNAHQGNGNYYLNTSVEQNPSNINQELNKGNTISVTWVERDLNGRTSGEMQIKSFKSIATSFPLSDADKENGITWQGTANMAFLMRYRSVGSGLNDTPALPPNNEPFSPWMDIGQEINAGIVKIISGCPVYMGAIKQNGNWTINIINVYNLADSLDSSSLGSNKITNPLPLLPEYDQEYGTLSYKIVQTNNNQSIANGSALAASSSPLRITDENLNKLKDGRYSFPTWSQDSSYTRLWWKKDVLAINDQEDNLKDLNGFTQTGNGNTNEPRYLGECVSFVEALSDQKKTLVEQWIQGPNVLDITILPGTVIATFSGVDKFGQPQFINGHDHTAVFKDYLRDSDGQILRDANGRIQGFEVWDQNWDAGNHDTYDANGKVTGRTSNGVVGTHYIYTYKGKAVVENGENYHVVEMQ